MPFCKLWRIIYFQSHSCCWQNPVPCSCRMEVLFSCWLLVFSASKGHSHSTANGSPFSIFKAANSRLQPSHASSCSDFSFYLSLLHLSSTTFLDTSDFLPWLNWAHLHNPGYIFYFKNSELISNLNSICKVPLLQYLDEWLKNQGTRNLSGTSSGFYLPETYSDFLNICSIIKDTRTFIVLLYNMLCFQWERIENKHMPCQINKKLTIYTCRGQNSEGAVRLLSIYTFQKMFLVT